ncbi:MAG: DUF4832 domain-containing protein [Chloroflexota bacterium]
MDIARATTLTYPTLPPIADNLTEYNLLATLPADLINQTRGGRPDENGLVGSNIPTFQGSHYQRGAMDLMTAGIVTGNDTDVADGWRAIDAAFTRQRISGESPGNFTNEATGGGDTPQDVGFWLAWLNHAVYLLEASPYEVQYRGQIATLKPKIELAMDFMMLESSLNYIRVNDGFSPNRSLIHANAFAFGYLLLDGTTDESKRAAYLAEAQWWGDRHFDNDHLYRSLDGVFAEDGGYDSSYHGVALEKALRLYIHFPTMTHDMEDKLFRAGRWLDQRILADRTIDATYNTRAGPGNEEGTDKALDVRAIKRALIYYRLLFDEPDILTRIDGLADSDSGISSHPPIVFSSLNITGVVGLPFSYAILTSNSAPEPNVSSITTGDLPLGLALQQNASYIKSTAYSLITGTPTVSGIYAVPITVTNADATSPGVGTGTATMAITVLDDGPPAVAIISPTHDTIYPHGTAVAMQVNATASQNRTIDRVEFYADNTLLSTDTSSPYTYTTTTLAVGTYIIEARVYDSAGDVSSEAVTTRISNRVYRVQNGMVVIEAEHDADRAVYQWKDATMLAGFAGVGYVTIPDGTTGNNTWEKGSEISYDVEIETAGDYYLAVRHNAADGGSDSVYAGFNGSQLGSSHIGVHSSGYNTWHWQRVSIPVTLQQGINTIQLRRREDGYAVDRLMIAQNLSDLPANLSTDIGPAESNLSQPEPTGIQAPQRMAFYYGWPSLVNSAGGDVNTAAATFGQFEIVVLGDGIQDTGHGDHANTTAIIAQLATQPSGHVVEVFGYADMRSDVVTAKQVVDDWAVMGVTGIFWNYADYAGDVDRTKQNELIDYTHNKGLRVMVRSWNPDDVLADDTGTIPSATHLTSNDIYLASGWLTDDTAYLSLSGWIDRVDRMHTHHARMGIRLAGLATGPVTSDLAWPSHAYQMALHGALMAELNILGYTNDQLSAWGDHANEVILPPAPTEGLGVDFTDSEIVHHQSNGIHIRRTVLGEFGIGGDGATWGLGYYRPFDDPLYTAIYYGADGWNVPNLQAQESWTGKKNSVVTLFTPLANDFPLEAIENLWFNGNTPLLTLEPFGYSAAQLAAGDADAQLTAWAIEFKLWLDSCGGRSAFLRFGHEMNGDWYSWGNDAANYVAAWQHIHTLFADLGIDSSQVQWVWAVNNVDVNTDPAENFYPGDSYVDWLGVDGYNWGESQNWSSWRDFPAVFDPMLTRLHAISPNKPILVAEIGTTGVSATTIVDGVEQGAGDPAKKNEWIAYTYLVGTKAYRQVKMAAYFNVDKGSRLAIGGESDWAVFNNGDADNPLNIPADEFEADKRIQAFADAMQDDLYRYEFPLSSVFGQSSVSATTTSTPTLGVVFHTTWNRANDQVRMDKAASIGAKVLRINVSWRLLERSNGVFHFDWYVPFVDDMLADAEARNLAVIFSLGEVPCWASSDPNKDCDASSHDYWYPPTSPVEYAEAFAFLVDRYGNRVMAWEVWNEPNVEEFWGQTTPDAATYTSLLQASYDAIKAVDTNAVVLGGSLAGTDTDYLAQMYTAGAKGHFDGLALHPYTSSSPSHCGSVRWGYQRGVEDIRNLMLAQGDDLPIWFTEFGWSSYDGSGGVGAANQAAYLAEALAIASGWDYVPVATWYNLVDRSDILPSSNLGYFGLFDLPNLNPKSAATTFRATAIEQKPMDLAITKTVSTNMVAPGAPISFTLTYINNGPSLATGIRITDSVAAGFTNITVSSTGVTITETAASPNFVWDVADLAVGEGGAIVIQAQISSTYTEATILTNRAAISTTVVDGTSLDTNTGNNQSQQTVLVRPGSTGSAGMVDYVATHDLYPNPERGFYKHTDTHAASYGPLSASTLSGYYRDNHTLILRVFYLEEFLNTPISQSYLDNMQADFNTLRTAGLKAVVRFAYTDTYKTEPPFGDASKAQVLAHIAQLKPVLQVNADVIATVQAGFIGTWGEWHFTDHFVADPNNLGNVTADDYADRLEIVNALLDALPDSIQVQIRTPEDKQHMFGDGSTGAAAALPADQALNDTAIARAAHHNDCFLASDTDYGTYQDITDDITGDKAYLELETRYLAMGGETCNPNPPRSQCATALAELERFHWTYLNSDYHPDVLSGWTADGCMEEITRRLGYRLVLQDGFYSNAVRPGDAFAIHVTVQNQGFAAPIKARPVKLLLRHTTNGDLYHTTLPVDVRTWLPADYMLDYTLCTPADIPVGDYDLLLHLPDRAEALAAHPSYAVRFANTGLWESSTGYHNLQHTLSVRTDATARACGNALSMKKVDAAPQTPANWLKAQQVPNSIVNTPFSGRDGAVISYRVPSDDAAYPFVFDRAWIYDNALAVIAWTLDNECAAAQTTLTTLASLVENDGKLGFSVSTQGDFVQGLYRSGAIAWVGYAFTLYQDQCQDSQFEATTRDMADWLLTQQDATGSVQGGPDATWHSTEHNIDAYFFWRDLGLLTGHLPYTQAASQVKTSLLTNHWNEGYGCFQQGIGDAGKALDAASWGAIFLHSIGEAQKAADCLTFLEANYPVTHTCTFEHVDYTVSGYKPYGDNIGGNTQVDLVWSEGSLGVAMAYQRVGDTAKRNAILANMDKMRDADDGIAYSCPPIPEKEWHDWESVAGTAWLSMVESTNQAEFWRTDSTTTTVIYISSNTGGRINGVRFHDEDILAVDVQTGDVQKLFDGSDMGIRTDLNAFHMLHDGSILMSFNRDLTINGLAVDESDIVRFIPTTLGENTAGTFSLYFDGDDVGLASPSEDIDAISLTPEGDLLISTLGSFRRNPSVDGTLNGKDEDIFRFSATSLGETTNGTWAQYFDGSDVGLTSRVEDVSSAIIVSPTGDILLTTRGAFTVTNNFTGQPADIVRCTPTQLGETTACDFSMYWYGDRQGFGAEKIDGVSLPSGVSLPIVAAGRGEVGIVDDGVVWIEDDVVDDEIYLPLILVR